MIRKADLVDAINDLNHDLLSLSLRVSELERKHNALVKPKCAECPSKKAANAAKQPRDKSGKFAKKK